jgi:hypothetical protein
VSLAGAICAKRLGVIETDGNGGTNVTVLADQFRPALFAVVPSQGAASVVLWLYGLGKHGWA